MVTSSILPLNRHSRVHRPSARFLSRRNLAILAFIGILLLIFSRRLSITKRDLGYLTRPLWDTPEPPWRYITHYPRPAAKSEWCSLHGWSPRIAKPLVIDAIPFAAELDALEIRMREYAGKVGILVIVEAAMTFAGTPKPLHFALNRERFETIGKEIGMRIVYAEIGGFSANLPPGSFDNEFVQRRALSTKLNELHDDGSIPDGSLVIQSDVDEIISGETLDLLTSCSGYPSELHLSVNNYLYSYNLPLGTTYWRPRIVSVIGPIEYHHGRSGDDILADAGWHCSFCFATLDEIRRKMMGFSHNDRLRDKSLLGEGLRDRVCKGIDPFNMWPEAFSFKNLIAQSGPTSPRLSFNSAPSWLRQHPRRFPYLLADGCKRPDH